MAEHAKLTELLHHMFSAAIDAASPTLNIGNYLPPAPVGRTIVVGAGKASAAMAHAIESRWESALTGLVIVPHGPHPQCRTIEIVQARHPVPDQAGLAASERILALVGNLTENDLVISLISGGGSALLSVPGHGITMADKQAVHSALLKSGAAIDEMNCVRKHLSAVKGGRLAALAHPAKVVTLTVSDVPGDDPATIASGPTVLNSTSPQQAMAIVERYNIQLPANVKKRLLSEEANTPRASDPRMSALQTHVICKPQQSLLAAADVARQAGLNPLILGDAIEGEAREAGKVMAGIAWQVLQYDQPATKPAVLISGGETTVTVQKKGGRGGRNAEFLLGFIESMSKFATTDAAVFAIAADTDGIDGTENNAGAIWTPAIARLADEKGLNGANFLDNNDAWSYFNALNALVETGPTHTNVNDFRAIVITS